MEGLIDAGFTPDRPSPPDPVHEPDRVTSEQVRAADHLAQRVRDLEQRLVAKEIEIERERSGRVSAQQLAAEKDKVIEVQANALRMLTVGQSDTRPTTTPVPAPSVPENVPQRETPRPGPISRLAGRFGL